MVGLMVKPAQPWPWPWPTVTVTPVMASDGMWILCSISLMIWWRKPQDGVSCSKDQIQFDLSSTYVFGTSRFAMRRLCAVACGPRRRSPSVMLGHACQTLAVMYLQQGPLTAENEPTTHRTHRTHRLCATVTHGCARSQSWSLEV
jgi:hypothetical protein